MQARGLLDGLESRVSRGVIGGLFAGLVFLLANMAFATSQDMPAVAPMLDISTIFNLTEKPEVTPENISVGLVTHLTLSALFGVAFALVVPLLRGPRAVLLAALAFGIGLYLVNFQILGRVFFEWFQEGPNQLFELFIHAVYGLLLVPFFASALERVETAHARRTPAPLGATARSAA
ncbi:MAG: hypothetical protein M3R46_15045 [Actinomycetota bacterium]|nr:hypothetical protein [Actinomycetota bacterium]